MLLKTLRMMNFRQYKGETNVTFAFEKDKNVTIILGDNTFGKTTLLQAFNWCFYKVALLPNASPLKKDRLNQKNRSSEKNICHQTSNMRLTISNQPLKLI